MNTVKPEIKENWDEWLQEFETNLKALGYKRFTQHYKREDFAYWKTFKQDGKKKYQVGLLFYDHRKYLGITGRIGFQYECMILCNDRIDMSCGKNIDVPEFEEMAETFYQSMISYASK